MSLDKDRIKPKKCPHCGKEIRFDEDKNESEYHHKHCLIRWGRRGWRQLGVYDG